MARLVGYPPDGYTAGLSLMGRTVGENIAAIRKARGLSQTQLADRLGVRQPTIAKWEKQTGDPELATLFQLAKELEATLDDFVDGVNADYDKKRLAHPPTSVINTGQGGKPRNVATDTRLLQASERHRRTLKEIRTLSQHITRIAILGQDSQRAAKAVGDRPRRRHGDRSDRR